jgi:hypothetical protein
MSSIYAMHYPPSFDGTVPRVAVSTQAQTERSFWLLLKLIIRFLDKLFMSIWSGEKVRLYKSERKLKSTLERYRNRLIWDGKIFVAGQGAIQGNPSYRFCA